MGKDAFRIYQPAALPARGSALPLLRIEAKESYLLAFISPRVDLYRGHWDKDRTVACVLGPEHCPRCLSPETPARTYGFCHVVEVHTKKDWCLMITSDGVHNLQDATVDVPHLRGTVAYVQREKGMKTRPLQFTIKDRLTEEQITRPPRPTLPTVRRIWFFETAVDPSEVEG